MKFTTAFTLAAAVIGVSADVHSTCWCETGGKINADLTRNACENVSWFRVSRLLLSRLSCTNANLKPSGKPV